MKGDPRFLSSLFAVFGLVIANSAPPLDYAEGDDIKRFQFLPPDEFM